MPTSPGKRNPNDHKANDHPAGAAVVNERSVAEMTGQRTATDTPLRLQHQNISARGHQQSCRAQAGQPTTDDDNIAEPLRGHVPL